MPLGFKPSPLLLKEEMLSSTPRHITSYNRMNTMLTIFRPITRTIRPARARLPPQINVSTGLRVWANVIVGC